MIGLERLGRELAGDITRRTGIRAAVGREENPEYPLCQVELAGKTLVEGRGLTRTVEVTLRCYVSRRRERELGLPLLDKLESAAAEGFSLCGRRLIPREVVSRIDGKEIPQVCFTLEYADVPGTEDGSGGQTDPAEPMGRMALRLERKEE